MGKIYRAEQIALSRSVALKVLHAHADAADGEDPQFKKRFLREASILARLQHPNIVTVFDYGSIEGLELERYFISMEYLSGETLARRISESGGLPTRDTVRIARQIARGLTEAHAHGVIHRDLKPSNVMLLPGRDGEEMVKIVDFGIVKIVGEEDSPEKEELTQEGSFIGSPKYMAPEQITRGGKIDARTDIYSFGIILYQCLTGTVPFDGASSIQTLMAHLNQQAQPLLERAPGADIPDWLELLVMSCIEKDPDKRPQTMEIVARSLAEAEAAINSSRVLAEMTSRSSSLPAVPNERFSTGNAGLKPASGITTQGTISSIRPEVPESEKTRTSPGLSKEPGAKRAFPLVPAVAGGAVVVLCLIGFFALRHHPEPPTPVVQVPVPPVVTATHFALRIESIPPGADVREGDRVLGVTPLELSLDDDAVRITPRSFTLSKDGFASYAITQGPSDDSVRIVAPLVALALPTPSATATAPSSTTTTPTLTTATLTAAHPRHGRAGPPEGTPATPPTAPPPPSHPDLDIRMNR
jgi:serine/threonine-protein kinase